LMLGPGYDPAQDRLVRGSVRRGLGLPRETR
jgi:hypothetical protein